MPTAYWVALAAGLVILGTAAWWLARARGVSTRIAVPVSLAFLTEYPFYLLTGFAGARAVVVRRLADQIVWITWATALFPYLVLTVGTGKFDLGRFAVWAALTGAVAFWFRTGFGERPVRGVLLLALLAGVILSGVLKWIFPMLEPKLPMEVLGHITLVRAAFWAVLLVGRGTAVTFGFVPTLRETFVGALWFVPCAAIALPLGLTMGEIKPLGHAPNWLAGIGLFLGVMWVLALSEEFFFRALLQRWISGWLRSRASGLVIASVIFGACHLAMHRTFPNWRYAALAAILGAACGVAFLQAGSMRASMVTHALAVTALRVFFRG